MLPILPVTRLHSKFEGLNASNFWIGLSWPPKPVQYGLAADRLSIPCHLHIHSLLFDLRHTSDYEASFPRRYKSVEVALLG